MNKTGEVPVVEAYAVSEPPPPVSAPPAHLSSQIDPPAPPQQTTHPHTEAREVLAGHKWPLGLQDTFISNLSSITHRFFICDDSGSMMASDGHRLMPNSAGQLK